MSFLKVGDRVRTSQGEGVITRVDRGYPKDTSMPYLIDYGGIGALWMDSASAILISSSHTPMVKKSKGKFEVGDKVVADKGAPYTITTNGWVGYVIRVDEDELLEVHEDPTSRRGMFVDADYFSLFKEKETAPTKPKELDYAALDALIIEGKVKDEITSVLKQHKHYAKLFTEWGLGEVIEYGKGMSFLFYGGPGTGKTWAAHCIAKVLGTELLVLDVANVQSAEPGAANRNIVSAFTEAKSSGKVLFIDECDSLITDRAHLGMILAGEVNTLLTEIEKFEGVVILATNRVAHMDEALERRISLIVEFPNPDYEGRVAIWDKMLPKKMPLGADVSKKELARHPLTGGQIKNAVLQAARLALAEEAKEVSKRHFDAAVDRVLASKNLMGTASRYHQHLVNDLEGGTVGPSMGKSRGMAKFLADKEQEADAKEKKL